MKSSDTPYYKQERYVQAVQYTGSVDTLDQILDLLSPCMLLVPTNEDGDKQFVRVNKTVLTFRPGDWVIKAATVNAGSDLYQVYPPDAFSTEFTQVDSIPLF